MIAFIFFFLRPVYKCDLTQSEGPHSRIETETHSVAISIKNQ